MSIKHNFISLMTIILTLNIILSGCILNSKISKNLDFKITDVNIYNGTPAWDLALAVREQKVDDIERMLKNNPELLNYQEPKYGASLLIWAIGMEKYNSAENLLKNGSDPNIALKTDGKTPLFIASGFSWVDNDAKKDPKYVKLLLKYGANPNKTYIGGDKNDNATEPGTSPLMESIGCGIDKTIALVEGGADVNYKTPSDRTAAIIALEHGGPNATLEAMEYAHYLIVQKKAKVYEAYYIPENVRIPSDNLDNKFYPVNSLRDWIYDINSDKYKLKMEIVEEFGHQGVNYWDTKIRINTIESIKRRYPDSWEEYIKKY